MHEFDERQKIAIKTIIRMEFERVGIDHGCQYTRRFYDGVAGLACGKKDRRTERGRQFRRYMPKNRFRDGRRSDD
ncbi:MAG: hypothetical protein H8D23_32850 [Candidatus Brocadiales bacterium]|nr:hypothetical protein [Candidatus Brocadiales bacterium]